MGQKMIPLLSVRKIRHAQPRPAQRTCVRAGGRLHSIVLLRDVMRLGPGGHMWKKEWNAICAIPRLCIFVKYRLCMYVYIYVILSWIVMDYEDDSMLHIG